MAKKIVDVEAGTVTFQFDDAGETVFNLNDMSEAMIRQLALHGASQKIGDSYAAAKSQTEELDIEPNEWSLQQATAVIGQLKDDDWTVRTPGSGGAISDLATALSEVTGQPVADCATRLADADKDEKAALRKHPDIASVLARLRRERAEKKEKELAAKAGSGPDLSGFFS